MITAEHTVTIQRPVEEVFAYLTDVSNVPQWQAGVSKTERESGEPVAKGTRFTEVRKFLGRELESTLEVTEYEQNHLFSIKTLVGPVPFEVRHVFQAADSGTIIEVSGSGEPGGFFKLGEALVSRNAARTFRKDFATLKSILERG
jgi:uncharacterized protein YndB with AHSA1/START domain